MLTAFAIRGFEEFGQRLQDASDAVADAGPEVQFRAIGIEYLRFAVERRPFFEVMFRSEMLNRSDSEFARVSHQSFGVLMGLVEAMDPKMESGPDPLYAAMGAWAQVHGLATLWLDGALSFFTDEDLFTIVLGVFEGH